MPHDAAPGDDSAVSDVARLPSVVEVDLETSRRGLPSRLSADLGGETVLVRTLQRILQCRRVAPPVVVVRAEQLEAAREHVGDVPVRWFPHEYPDLPQRELLRRGRRWGKEGWRGGLAESLFVCEQGNPSAFAALCAQENWSAIAVLPAEAPFLDPAVIDEIAGAFLDGGVERKLFLSTAPPGIGADILSRELLDLLANHQRSVADVLGFRPDQASGNPDSHFSHPFPMEISGARGRFTVDSHSSLAQAEFLWREVGKKSTDCRALFQCLAAHPDVAAGSLPEELIFELASSPEPFVRHEWLREFDTEGLGGTGALNSDSLADVQLPSVLSSTEGTRARIVEALAARDDALLTIDGSYQELLLRGDPEHFLGRVRREAFGLHFGVSAYWLHESLVETLCEAAPDVVTVDLGATDANALDRIAPGTPSFEARERGLEALVNAVEKRGSPSPRPFVVATVTIDEASVNHFEPVFDRWHARVDRLVVRGLEGPCGQRVDRSAGVFAPPERAPCVRLTSQLRVRADGAVPLCNRDPHVSVSLGDLEQESVAEIWQGEGMRRARGQHARREWDALGHCGLCASWFRLD